MTAPRPYSPQRGAGYPRRSIQNASGPLTPSTSAIRPNTETLDLAWGELPARTPWLQAQSLNLIRQLRLPAKPQPRADDDKDVSKPKDQVYAIVKQAAREYPEVAAPIRKAKDEAKARQREGGKKAGRARADRSGSRDPNLSTSADAIGRAYGVSGATVKRVGHP